MPRSKYQSLEVNNTAVTVDMSMLRKHENVLFNATEIAKQHDKNVQTFLRMDETKQYIKCLVEDSKTVFKTELELIIAKRGKYGGTWLHQSLALRFARWCSVSFEYALDRWLESTIHEEQQRKQAREAMRAGYKPLTDAIQHAHHPAKPYHYSNEANMINNIILGMSAKAFKQLHEVDEVRDACDAWQGHMLDSLQRINTSLIEIGLPFEERKQHLETKHRKELELVTPTNDEPHFMENAA